MIPHGFITKCWTLIKFLIILTTKILVLWELTLPYLITTNTIIIDWKYYSFRERYGDIVKLSEAPLGHSSVYLYKPEDIEKVRKHN